MKHHDRDLGKHFSWKEGDAGGLTPQHICLEAQLGLCGAPTEHFGEPPASTGPQSGSLPPGSLPMVKGIGMVTGIMGKTCHRKAAHKQQSPSQHKYCRTPVYLLHASPDLHSQKMAALSHICAATMLPIP